MRDFRELKVWEKAHLFTLDIYKASLGFPDDERYGLTSQLRRASTSIPTNIAEGCGRRTEKELAQFLQIAVGSASEVDYLLQLTHELQYIKSDRYEKLVYQIVEIRKMLIAFIKPLRLK